MRRSLLIAPLALAAAGLTVGSVAAAPTTTPAGSWTPVPPELAVPAGNVLTSTFSAAGVQVYRCTSGAWTFVEPAAALSDRYGRTQAVHFRGPSWESTVDGTLVEGAVEASVPVPGSIPQLRLHATTTRGTGTFGGVTFIQRLRTTGGAAPTGSCTEGSTTGVRYTAEYRFYKAA